MVYNTIFTGLFDEEGSAIFVGDILLSEYGFTVTVCLSKEGDDFYGSLNCEIGHSCRDIPYALNNGKGYIKVYGTKTNENNDL